MINFECSICLENIKYPSVGSCMHHYCYYCLYKWCKHSNKCPLCKELILEIKLDREFDTLVNGYSLPVIKFPNLIILSPIHGIKDPGLTIKNNNNGPGVIIVNVKLKGLFNYYNIKKNEIILFINEIPCMNHKNVIEQIMALHISHKNINCIFLH